MAAPPNYRSADINPVTPILADLAQLATLEGPPEVNLILGDPDFGEIAGATAELLGFDFTSDEAWYLGVAVRYTGDNGAFVLTGLGNLTLSQALTDQFAFTTAIVGSNSGTSTIEITATAADDGVEKTGTLTFYDRYYSPPREVLVLNLIKTYNAP